MESPSENKLRTANDVIHRWRWDEQLRQRGPIMIGYEDRFHGPMEISIESYRNVDDGGDVPEHRILYFRRLSPQEGLGEILWDRAGRVDRIFHSGKGEDAEVACETKEAACKAMATMKRLEEERREEDWLQEHEAAVRGRRGELAAAVLQGQSDVPQAPSSTLPREQSGSSTASHNRKRPLENYADSSSIQSSQSSIDTSVLTNLRKLRLEAIFHPKFENENRSDQQIREAMKHRVQSRLGYLEVTVKHSGSLLLWSGGQRYYSKNSTENKFTHVGEILLRQHFVRAFWNDRFADPNARNDKDLEAMYKQCSDHVEENRLTLAFEVVTSVLGDHGARPNRDFLILTAVADRTEERFYSTTELVELAHQFRLPHNDSWVYRSAETVASLFNFYDSCRETGLACDVVEKLSQTAEAHVESMYPHGDFQGQIMEGIVIRYVPYHGRVDLLERIEALSRASHILREMIPSDLPSCFELLAGAESTLPILTADIRSLYQEAAVETASVNSFEFRLRSTLARGEERRVVDRVPRSSNIDIPSLANNLLQAGDEETRRIASLIQSLSMLGSRVDYSVICEMLPSVGGKKDLRWICTIHVIHDQTFQKYRRNMKPDSMALFRGFALELDVGGAFSLNDSKTADRIHTDKAAFEGNDSDDHLMLKMKFLPYMVRTFCCRNGLRTLKHGGTDGFLKFAADLLVRWHISREARLRWQPFFKAWAGYAKACMAGQPPVEEAKPLPLLTETCYLDHLELFQTLYEAGRISQVRKGPECDFRGLLVVVTIQPDTRVADYISEKLGGARRIADLNSISDEEMLMMCQPRSGAVCSAIVADGVGSLRRLLKAHSMSISVVLFQCSEDDVAAALLPEKESKKTLGILKSWRKTRCSYLIELPGTSLFDEDAMDTDDHNSPYFRPSDDFVKMLTALKKASEEMPVADTRPGVLVFFPGIPGCGKSSLLGQSTEMEIRRILSELGTEQARKLIVRVGDKTKGKYWQVVKQERTRDLSSVYIADKNVPCSAWDPVAGICSATKAVAVPVLPESSALQTTIITGIRTPGRSSRPERVHIYPFSLPYLAVCMSRVMARPPGTHAGKLDSGTKRACFIVIKFFSFYRKIGSDEIQDTLKARFANHGALVSSSPIQVPFFANNDAEKIPDDLAEVLIEAIQAQYGYDLEKADTGSDQDAYLDELETRLRGCIDRHYDLLQKLPVDISVSRENFVSRLAERVAEVDSMGSYTEVPSDFIKIASIDVNVNDVHGALRESSTDERISSFVSMITDGHAVDAVLAGEKAADKRFVRNTHVTMAHFREMSQADMKATFGPICRSRVGVTATSLLWSSRVAAFGVALANKTDDGRQVPPCSNAFCHITIWRGKGASAVEANHLPGLVGSSNASRIDFEKPISLQGTVSLWKTGQSSN